MKQTPKPGSAKGVNPASQRPAPKGSHMAPSDAKGSNVQPPPVKPGSTPTAKSAKKVTPPKKIGATSVNVVPPGTYTPAQ